MYIYVLCMSLYTCPCTACRIGMGTKDADKTSLQLLEYSLQIASAMNYLSNRSYVHRDLAARNVLLDEKYVSKVSTGYCVGC